MTTPVRRIPCSPAKSDPQALLTREWLLANGLGGFASGTLAGVNTRRYHGLLVAALPAPLGRVVMLGQISEEVTLPDGTALRLEAQAGPAGELELNGARYLTEFALDAGLPSWRYEVEGSTLERRVLMPHMQNTVHVTYRLLSGNAPVKLRLRPYVDFLPLEGGRRAAFEDYVLTVCGTRYEVAGGAELPRLRLMVVGEGAAFTLDGGRVSGHFCQVEAERGYPADCTFWSPGYFQFELLPRGRVTLVASVEAWPTVLALTPTEAASAEQARRERLLAAADPLAQEGLAAELVLAADQFIIAPAGRAEELARARAAGDEEVRTVIAGYHWFTDWGRDTMISLEGLTLTTGRHAEAGWILRTFAHYVRDGLVPNLFPEGTDQGLYHTADATLWFFHALERYVRATGDRTLLEAMLPVALDILEHHLVGTRFGIGVDPADGLLRQGAPGYQLTWMDAKVGDWVVTPRRGKAVEVNALWYNALRLAEGWVRDCRGELEARCLAEHAERARESFNRRFWYPGEGYLYDVVDGEAGDDPSCRPNQVLAVSLDHPVLERSRWLQVLRAVRDRLLTPVGLRSLAPGHPDYKRAYFGDLRARDAAYHQGTVWAWLIGPFFDAWKKAYPEDEAGARALLQGFAAHLDEACVGSISEVFDAEPPFTPRGCVAQAWSVAEVLRCSVAARRKGAGSRASQ